MKPSLFVGSSREAIVIAEAVQQNLQHLTDVTIWNQSVFNLSKSTLQSLLKTLREHDFDLFILAPDDLVLLRNDLQHSTRDNVMFELGMFMAFLGQDRCFFVMPSNIKDFRIPTDLLGITPATYDTTSHQGNIRAMLGAACSDISNAIRSTLNVSGKWALYISGSKHEEPNGVMFLVCAGDKATANLNLTKSLDGQPVLRHFRYEGRYVAGQIAMTFEQRGAGDQIVGAMILKAKSNRTEILGQTVFWHHDEGQIVTTQFRLCKLKD